MPDTSEERRLARNEYSRNYYRNNLASRLKRENYRKIHPTPSHKNTEYVRRNRRKYAGTDKQKKYARNEQLKHLYGITLDQYNELLQSQNNLCACCGQPPKIGKALCVDHDHNTGKIRQLLCDRCNLTIGRVNDDPTILKRMVVYLENHSSKISQSA